MAGVERSSPPAYSGITFYRDLKVSEASAGGELRSTPATPIAPFFTISLITSSLPAASALPLTSLCAKTHGSTDLLVYLAQIYPKTVSNVIANSPRMKDFYDSRISIPHHSLINRMQCMLVIGSVVTVASAKTADGNSRGETDVKLCGSIATCILMAGAAWATEKPNIDRLPGGRSRLGGQLGLRQSLGTNTQHAGLG